MQKKLLVFCLFSVVGFGTELVPFSELNKKNWFKNLKNWERLLQMTYL